MTLDRDSDVWVGTFADLGTVRIFPGGEFVVEPAAAGDEDQITALTYGWAQPLAWARQGIRLTNASTVVDPDGRCLALHGDAHDAAIIMLHLTQLGWSVLSDRPTPVRWNDASLIAHPNPAPILIAQRRADKEALPARPVRQDSDSVAVELPRSETPAPIAAIISARTRRVNDPLIEPLTGLRRFEAANGLLLAGALSSDDDPKVAMADTLRIAQLPWAYSYIESATKQEAVAAIQAWWEGLCAAK